MPEIRTEMEQLQFLLTECENLRREDIFPNFKKQLTLFMNMLQKYMALFKEKNGGVSANNEDYDAFLKELQEVSVSCSKWLNDKKADVEFLQPIFKSLKSKGIPFVSSKELKSIRICDQATNDKPGVRVRFYDEGAEIEHFHHSEVYPYVVGCSVILAGVAAVVAVVLKFK
ncbi:Hypothetical predicted protein [Paramuricea clavata]|uniref:Uncharacterized protein n=1 Tax=Paramuricea clavata TaxID=317549 RepID=A0A6S7J5J9_PARCT|nr:Hypothetical predicted protein [Paramuricea clavata]